MVSVKATEIVHHDQSIDWEIFYPILVLHYVRNVQDNHHVDTRFVYGYLKVHFPIKMVKCHSKS